MEAQGSECGRRWLWCRQGLGQRLWWAQDVALATAQATGERRIPSDRMASLLPSFYKPTEVVEESFSLCSENFGHACLPWNSNIQH